MAINNMINDYERRVTKTTPTTEELPEELRKIAEMQARASHEGWMQGKISMGYIWGPDNNDDPAKGPLTSPNLVPYDELDEETKLANIANAVAVLKIMKGKKVEFVGFTQDILYPLAEQIHDEWCRTKFQDGWTWGPVTDKARKIHRDLVPFEVLASDPELVGDIKYDVDTAREIIIKMISDNDVFPMVTDLAAYKRAAS